MRIEISQRYKPFSHLPGSAFVIPKTSLGVEVYPTYIRVYDLASAVPVLIKEHHLKIHGPVSDFTVQQDLEKGQIKVWGHYKQGYLRYSLSSSAGGKNYIITVEKSPELFAFTNSPKTACADEVKTFCRLSLGNHRAQDWELIKRRADLKEILPLWLRLGQLTPQTFFEGWKGTLSLLKKCQEAIDAKEKLILYETFLNLFKGAFQGGLYPTLIDSFYQGYDLTPPAQGFKGSPLFLLTEGAKAIQNLFISIQSNELSFLEALPPQFHCGRFIDVDCGHLGSVSMEWSKKTIRRIIFQSKSANEVLLRFQKGLKRFRLRVDDKDRGKFIDIGYPLALEKEVIYFLDNFQA